MRKVALVVLAVLVSGVLFAQAPPPAPRRYRA